MLDVSIRIGILNLMRQLKEQHGLAFLYITHDIASARYIADEVMVMYAGQVVESGTTEGVLQSPLHPYTRLLLSAVPTPESQLRTRKIEARGEVPSVIDPAEGCRFAPRCPFVMDICRTTHTQTWQGRSRSMGTVSSLSREQTENREYAVSELANRFPPDFLFGTATASYQIEGAIDRGWAGTFHLGHFLLHPWHDIPWPDRCSRLRPLQPLPIRHRPHGRSRHEGLSLLDRLAEDHPHGTVRSIPRVSTSMTGWSMSYCGMESGRSPPCTIGICRKLSKMPEAGTLGIRRKPSHIM